MSAESAPAPSPAGSFANNPYVQEINKHLLQLEKDLHLEQYPALENLSEKTKLPKIYLVLIAALILFALIAHYLGLSFLSNLFAFFPCYHSFKALRSPGKDDDAFWLTYWVVYGSLTLLESLLDEAFFWLPFYFIFKIVLMVWAYHPNSKGAMTIYNVVLKPIFLKAEEEVEEIEKEVQEIEERHHRASSSQPPGGAHTD